MKTIKQALEEKILYIGDKIPKSLLSDIRPKFIVLGTPQEFIDETSRPLKLNKDFYDDILSMVCEQLEGLIEKYGKEDWFETAWEEYRQHVKSSDIDTMKMPEYVFNKFLFPLTNIG